MPCELCALNEGFTMTVCRSCNVPMVVLNEHRAEFTETEKKRIKYLFPEKKIRWEMRSVKGHAHCHLEE